MANHQSSNSTQNKQSSGNTKSNRGFSSMNPDKQQRDAANKSNQNTQQKSATQKPTPEEARLTSSKATDNSRKADGNMGPDTCSSEKGQSIQGQGGAYDLPVQPRQSDKKH
ncbi:hypothetical protein ACUHMQ_17655 [Chitinimonas sp. PSY-7]|uniref:hypothetical protein n=1 Tax=Chitinimonas sp. PSY-7 TaxID=3459088 RepID=UPI004040291E